MKKSTKILIGAVAVTLAVCVLIVAIASHNKNKPHPPADPTISSGDTTYFDLDPSNAPDLPTNAPTESTEPTAPDLSKAILGKWMDSANMSGYEFMADGTVSVTYVNLTIPFINLPINGSATGTYTLSGNELMMKYSIYTKTIVKRFFVSVNDNELSMRDLDEGDNSTYRRAAADAEYSTAPVKSDDELTGTWVNADASMRFVFNEDNTINLTLVGFRDKSVSRRELNGSFTGLYVTQGNYVTIQFMDGDDRITLEYTYQVSRNTLLLTDKNNGTTLFVRAGTGASSYSSAEDLRGKWRDSTGTNGYNFKEGGIVELTLVNFTVPVINMPINGTYNGTYQVDGDKLTIRYSVFGKSITDVYRFSVDGGTLTLTNEENGKVSSYMR